MTVSVSNIVRDVRVVLDQNMSSTALSSLPDVDTLSLDDLIESKIEDAARLVVESAPLPLLSDVVEAYSSFDMDMRDTFPYYGSIPLPTTFLRLVSFQMDSWEYPVHEAISPLSPLYKQVQNRYGIIGTPEKPVVCVKPSLGDGSPVLEFYSASEATEDVHHCTYVAIPKITTSGNTKIITLGAHLERPTVYYAASLVAKSIRENELADKLAGTCTELLTSQ